MSETVIIGGGPAGLTAAYELTRNNHSCVLLEQQQTIGGIARTEEYQGYHFDLGGHRFFSKSAEINQLWHEILGPELLTRSRLSRIYYHGKYFNYPLKPLNALRNLGLGESCRIIYSYLWQKLFPYWGEKTFEQWVSNRFGQRLYEIFFKSYTEKVWGISCQELSAEWAAQRIKDLNLTRVVVQSLLSSRAPVARSLISEFKYPRLGPGMMWLELGRRICEQGGEVCLGEKVVRVGRACLPAGRGLGRIENIVLGSGKEIQTTQLINSMPLRELILLMHPAPPEEIIAAAKALRFREFLTIALIIDQPDMFPDNWLYIHEPAVKLGRIQNFKNWSPAMVPDQTKTCLGLEYFCNAGDELWNMSEEELIALGTSELVKIKLLADPKMVLGGKVMRVKNAYPVYDQTSTEQVKKIRAYLAEIPNLQTIGRAGMHRYNNMDHSMLTGLYAARNIIGPKKYDLWAINDERGYLEDK